MTTNILLFNDLGILVKTLEVLTNHSNKVFSLNQRCILRINQKELEISDSDASVDCLLIQVVHQ